MNFIVRSALFLFLGCISYEGCSQLNLQTKQLTTFSGASKDVHPPLMYLFANTRGQLWVMQAGVLYRFDPQKASYTYVMGPDSRHNYG